MKKLYVIMLSLLTSGTLVALPLGNPAEPALMTDGVVWEGVCSDWCDPCASWCDAFSFRAGFYGDYVYNRHVESRDDLDNGADVGHLEIYTNAAYLAANLFNRIDFFTTLGVTNLYMKTDTDLIPFSVESEPGFSWSVGARLVLVQCGCMTLGAEGQYFHARSSVKRVGSNFVDNFYFDSAKWNYEEWQLGVGVSYRIWNLVPYLGAKWSRMDDNKHIRSDLGFTEATKNRFEGGFVLGCSFVDCERALVTVETRFPDEKALYVNGQFRF